MIAAVVTRAADRVASARKWLIAGGIVFVGCIPLLTSSAYIQNVMILTFLMCVLGLGWNIMSGYTGYISLGHSAFIGIGAYTAGILAERWQVSPFLVAPLGGVAAALVAFLLGLTTRRTRGPAFVIVSFALLELLGLLARNLSSLTGGSQGLAMPLPDWDLTFYNWPFYYSLLALVLLSLWMTRAIRRSKFGLGLVAIRDDEDKAAGIGVLTPVYKSLAFMSSAVLVGVAGAVYGYYVSYLSVSTMFDIVLSMQVVLAVLIGGRGTFWGPVLGAFIVVPLTELTNTTIGGLDAGAFRLLMFGGLLLLVTMLLPRGILPTAGAWLTKLKAGDTGRTGARLVESGLPTVPPSLRDESAAVGGDVLRVEDVVMRFGGVLAIDQASFSVPRGSITALIGPNGAGKTTLFNAIDGTYTPAAGDIVLEGKSLARADRTRRAFRGIGRTYQLPRLFNSLTVLENVAAVNSSFSVRRLAASAVSGEEAARATELLEFVGLGDYLDVKATDMSYGQKKLVELAQVLMLDPAVILLDEPAAGINPTLLRRLADLIRALNESGRTFVIVEHDMQFVLALADRATVLARGQVLMSGAPDVVSRHPKVMEAYLGDDFVLEKTMGGATT
ncbi:amino acid/amide ABC transporter membrane protein 2, HAAT family /amino acid/amide ABC transporter ATP-binding protein 1, HAAT family [Nocardioides sp. YR527]|uniref:branched-chain amino acid ABC transporter ATP-binding protein/permease n=1 Tax=Nocardioides sp. YR527 TaxID=1881028 RepID=UPI0008865121|nr:branched-chain amino acid ABC transporter ATP-binding protein/permease [Nocardioides sp. YR527]SDK57135.1 amino acid/amide ABC transporter membrane protein 2, HAAT family /amino acid/amide ABC transporter ATP-binding protein 1, HAAT family [Nocardioides sp. YR527]